MASYSLRAPHNAMSGIGDPAEVRGKNICQITGKSKTGGGEVVALGVLATLEARMRFEGKGER